VDKKKKELILIACLIPVLGFVLYNSLSSEDKKKQTGAPKSTTPQAVQPVKVPVVAPATKTETGELLPFNEKLDQMQKVIAEEAWGRDPFQEPPVKESDRASTSLKDFKLTGVIPGRTATINGEIIGVGEVFEGYLLIKVENYRITLKKSEQLHILNLPEE